MQPTENQDSNYLPRNSVDRSIIWMIVGLFVMLFLMAALISRQPATDAGRDDYLSRKTSEIEIDRASGDNDQEDVAPGIR